MKKVMCFGTFDILHLGHEFYLSEAKKLGNYLVVVVARDATVAAVKGKLPQNGEQKRLANLKKLGIADKVMLGHAGDKLKVVEQEKPDILAFGYDQEFFTKGAKEILHQRGISVEVFRLASHHPDKYKSSLLRK